MHEKVGGQTPLIDPALEKVGGQLTPWPRASAVYDNSSVVQMMMCSSLPLVLQV